MKEILFKAWGGRGDLNMSKIQREIASSTMEKGYPSLEEILNHCADEEVDIDGRKIVRFEKLAEYLGVDPDELLNEIQKASTTEK
jgi:hypothetical protein